VRVLTRQSSYLYEGVLIATRSCNELSVLTAWLSLLY